jgi:Flp pilus assembly protein TadG
MTLLIAGGIELGMVMISRQQLEFATEAAAKCFATNNPNPNPNPNRPCASPQATAAYAVGLLPALGISSSNFNVTTTTCSGVLSGVVTGTYTYTPMILPSNIDIGASACWPI